MKTIKPKTQDWQEYLLLLIEAGVEDMRAIRMTVARFHKYTLPKGTLQDNLEYVQANYYGYS